MSYDGQAEEDEGEEGREVQERHQREGSGVHLPPDTASTSDVSCVM